VLGGDVMPNGDVLLWDDAGTHSSLSAAEMIAASGARLEIVTPERMLGIEVGGMNHVPYARAFNQADVRITLNQRVLGVRPEGGRLCVEIGSDLTKHRTTRHVDYVITDHGTAVNAGLYFELKQRSVNLGAVDYGALMEGRPQALHRNGDGAFQLFRIGDAVASRNIHAAVYDALRLVKDL
jgi:N-methyl-L-proline demethylase